MSHLTETGVQAFLNELSEELLISTSECLPNLLNEPNIPAPNQHETAFVGVVEETTNSNTLPDDLSGLELDYPLSEIQPIQSVIIGDENDVTSSNADALDFEQQTSPSETPAANSLGDAPVNVSLLVSFDNVSLCTNHIQRPHSISTFDYNGHSFELSTQLFVRYIGPNVQHQTPPPSPNQHHHQYASTPYGQTVAESMTSSRVSSSATVGSQLERELTQPNVPTVAVRPVSKALCKEKIIFTNLGGSSSEQHWMPAGVEISIIADNEQLVQNVQKAQEFWSNERSTLISECKKFLDGLRKNDQSLDRDILEKIQSVKDKDYVQAAEDYLRELENVSGDISHVECTRQEFGTITMIVGTSKLKLGHQGRKLCVKEINEIKNIEYLFENNKNVASHRKTGGAKNKKRKTNRY
jgi:hypothetical protein